MNRLWVRIALTIAMIVVFLVILPIAVDIAFTEFAYYPYEEAPDLLLPGLFVLYELAFPIGMAILVSVVAGIWVSRSLTSPLSKLAEAARAIGRRDLGRRVEEKGSREMRDLALAFNQMADNLEKTEELRSDMLADVAHELRTPLSVVQGNLRAILDDVFELDKQEIALLYDQTRHLSRLVEDLRELAQAEAEQLNLNVEALDLADLAGKAVEAFRPAAEEAGLDLRLEIEAGLPMIRADAQRMTQVLHNLVDNALRYSNEGGDVLVGMQKEGKGVRLSVRDEGRGIAEEDLPLIFERFYRAEAARDRDSGGTGLGLAIVKALIEAQGGKVGVESKGLGKGSAFWVWLPDSS